VLTMNSLLEEISPELVLVDPELAPLARLHLPEPGSFGRSATREPEALCLGADEAGLRVLPAREAGRKSRPWLVFVAALSLGLNGMLVWHARSRGIERPSLVEPARSSLPVRSSLSSNLETPSQMRAENPAAVLASSTTTEEPAPKPAGPISSRRAGVLERSGPNRQSHPAASKPRSRTEPVPEAKGASKPPALPEAVVAGSVGRQLRWKAVAGASYYNLILWHRGRRVLDLWPTRPRTDLPTAWRHGGTRYRLLPGRYLWFAYAGFGAKASRHYGALAGNGILVVRGSSGS
jgi:hypothetical protein